MFVEFEQDKSYLWLFAIMLPVCLLLTLIGSQVSNLLGMFLGWGLPGLWLTICEMRSGVLLDSWWRATYIRGSFVYELVIRIQIILITFLILFIIYRW